MKSVYPEKVSILHPVHLLLEPEEDTRTIEVRAVTDPMKQADELGLVADVPLHKVIKSERYQDAQHQHDIQLYVDRTAHHVADPPAQHHKEVQRHDRKRRRGMRAAQADEHVVQVRLVGMERRLALQNARRHHSQRIENRDRQHRQRKGNQPDIGRIIHLAQRTVLQNPHHEDRHDDSHDQRSAVTDEHLRGLAEQVVEEEGDERTGGHHGQHGHHPVADIPEHHPEKEARQNAVARRESVHAVNQVDGVDDAHGRKDRQRNGCPARNLVDTPQSVEIVQAVVSDEDQQQHRTDLDQEAKPRRKIQNIVQRSGVEHDHHRHDDDEQLGTVTADAGNPQPDNRSEEDGDTAQHGRGFALQLARVGIVDNVLVEGNLYEARMDPADAQQRNQKR